MDKVTSLVRSRKFWAALVGLALVIIKAYKPDFPINEEQVTQLVYVLVAYILGVALEDGLSTRSGSLEITRGVPSAGEDAAKERSHGA